MENKLNPCKCGGRAETLIGKDEYGDEYYYCECQQCFTCTDGVFILAAGDQEAQAEASKLWNKRNTNGTK